MRELSSASFEELTERMHVLHTKHYIWLLQSAINVTKSNEEAEDLIGDLYLYLMEKGTKKLYYKDSFNLLYCYRFLETRWINKINKKKRLPTQKANDSMDCEDEIYSLEEDERIMETFDAVQDELEKLSKTRNWPKAKLFQLYYESDDTMLEVAQKIGISKSTTYISIKIIREHLKKTLQNPFINE